MTKELKYIWNEKSGCGPLKVCKKYVWNLVLDNEGIWNKCLADNFK